MLFHWITNPMKMFENENWKVLWEQVNFEKIFFGLKFEKWFPFSHFKWNVSVWLYNLIPFCLSLYSNITFGIISNNIFNVLYWTYADNFVEALNHKSSEIFIPWKICKVLFFFLFQLETKSWKGRIFCSRQIPFLY